MVQLEVQYVTRLHGLLRVGCARCFNTFDSIYGQIYLVKIKIPAGGSKEAFVV